MPTQKVDFLPFAGYNVGNVSVAQLDRVTASDAVGFGFDSRQAHHKIAPAVKNGGGKTI